MSSLPSLRHNLAVCAAQFHIANSPGPNAAPKVWAVIKADAYGHGIENAVQAFELADGLAMLDLNEAVRCREAGWTKPILLL
jgi:alanine racemase